MANSSRLQDILLNNSAKVDKEASVNHIKNEVLSNKGLNPDGQPSDLKIFGKEYFINYELSWLKFNWRVLHEAQNPNNTLLERVKFIGIVCSNLDEFYQKRVGGLKRQYHAGVRELTIDGRRPEQQLKEIRKNVKKIIKRYRSCYLTELIPALDKQGVHIKHYDQLSDELKEKADDYFQKQVYPIITPLAVDEAHPFPFISSK